MVLLHLSQSARLLLLLRLDLFSEYSGMAVLSLLPFIDLFDAVEEAIKSRLVAYLSRQWLWIWKKHIEDFHAGFVRCRAIDLEHQAIQVLNVLHPRP